MDVNAGIIGVYLLSPRPRVEGKQRDADNELDWVWVQGLRIPQTHIFEFSAKPYKWIRSVAGALLGAKGILCDSVHAGAVEIDYDRPLSPGDSSVYFHTDQAEHGRFFPLDPSLARSSAISGSSTSSRSPNFRSDVVARDVRCVATDAPASRCQAAHLIGHAKGNDYIEALTAARSGGYETIDDIDDVRNGFLVKTALHECLGQREVAFLLTPNFAMSTSDVDVGLSLDANRWTVHDFKGVLDPDVQDRTRSADVPHKQPLRVPTDESQWPPRVIFDSIYASVVARYFGHGDFTIFARNHWQSRHYPSSHRNTHDKEWREGRLNRRHDRADTIEEMDPLDMIFCISQFARAPRKAEQRERWTMDQQTMEAAKCAELDQKVTSWMRAVK